MSMVEFYEALGRIAEEASLVPLTGIYDDEDEWLLDKRRQLPLGHKLEGLILKIFEYCCDV